MLKERLNVQQDVTSRLLGAELGSIAELTE
jgi:hypothetical protein